MMSREALIAETLDLLNFPGIQPSLTTAAKAGEARAALASLSQELREAKEALRIARPYMYLEYGTGDWEAELKADQDIVDAVLGTSADRESA